jgi:hypothetical protein
VDIAGIALVGLLIVMRSRLEEEDQVQGFITTYPTFFEDFKGEGLRNWWFYVLYFIRRILIVFCVHFISDGTLQLSISFVMSISVIQN